MSYFHCLCVVRFLLGVIPVSLPKINSLSMYMYVFIICLYLQFILYIYFTKDKLLKYIYVFHLKKGELI